MENKFLEEAQSRVQLVGAVHEYQFREKDPLKAGRETLATWIGDIFDLPQGRYYVPLDHYQHDAFKYNKATGLISADPRDVSYNFKLIYPVQSISKVEGYWADKDVPFPKESPKERLFAHTKEGWISFEVAEAVNFENVRTQHDILLVRQTDDLSKYEPAANERFFNTLSLQGVPLPPIIYVKDYWVYSDGWLGEGLLARTSQGWREIYAGGAESSDYRSRSVFLHPDNCVGVRHRGMGSPDTINYANVDKPTLDNVMRYFIDLTFMKHLKEGHPQNLSFRWAELTKEKFRLAGFLATKHAQQIIVEDDDLPEIKTVLKIQRHLARRIIIFPLKASVDLNAELSVTVYGAQGRQAILDFQDKVTYEDAAVDPKRYANLLKSYFEQPLVQRPYIQYNSRVDWAPG